MGLPPLPRDMPSNTVSTTSTLEVANTTPAPTTALVQISHELPSIIPEGKISIEICIHCFRYQRRLCHMLSSLYQQKGDIPNIIVNISYTDNDGTPTTEEVCKFFRDKGLNIVETKVTKEEVSNRALARNKQATATTADWILFADADMVYSEYFFDDLQKRLKTIYKDIELVMGADRHSLDDKTCLEYFEKDNKTYPCVVENVEGLMKGLKLKWITGRGSAPGNFQLISGKVLKGKCKGKITDRAGDHWRRTKGDRALRVRVGGRMAILTKEQYHLNHDRGDSSIQR
jgi:glycosyltransferase involved in cell wall biosynthesis